MLKNVDGTTIEAQAAAQPKTRPGPLAWVQRAAGEKWTMERVGMNYRARSGINLRAMDFYFIANGIEAVRVRYKHPTRTLQWAGNFTLKQIVRASKPGTTEAQVRKVVLAALKDNVPLRDALQQFRRG